MPISAPIPERSPPARIAAPVVVAHPGASGSGAGTMRVLVACEFSATVRDAFRARGHDAWSVDLVPTEGDDRWHLQGDCLAVLDLGWDLLIAHPPCTDLAVSGARHFGRKRADGRIDEALRFVRALMDAPIPRKCIENPVSLISTAIKRPSQVIQPWQYGHGETKATCLWLEGLPLLMPTSVVAGRAAVVHRMPPGPDRARNRSRTYRGVAQAMADQWGGLVA